MKTSVLFLSILLGSGLLLVNIYTSMIDARSWGSDVPVSVETARNYFKTANPGDFFRIFSPLNQVIALLVLILFWKTVPSVRMLLGSALILYVVADVFTFAYFYPRNEIIFMTAQLSDTDLLKQTISEWSRMNWLRSAIVLAGVCCSFAALVRIISSR